MGKSDVKLDIIKLLSGLKQNEAFYMYFYKNYQSLLVYSQTDHIENINNNSYKISNSSPTIHEHFERLDLIIEKNTHDKEHGKLFDYTVHDKEHGKLFDYTVMCLVENGLLPNDHANGYLKITADEELLSKPLKLLRKNLRNIEVHRFVNECNICMKKSSDSPVSKPKGRKKSTTTKTTEDVQLYSNLPEPITRKTTMSDKEKASREKCPSCGSIKCNGDWETYKKTLPPNVQNSKNELKRRKDAFAKKHSLAV